MHTVFWPPEETAKAIREKASSFQETQTVAYVSVAEPYQIHPGLLCAILELPAFPHCGKDNK